MGGAAGPHFLPVDDVPVAAALGAGADLGGVGSGARLGHPERLQPQLAARDSRQVVGLLLGAAVTQQGAHGVHLGVAGGGAAAHRVQGLEDYRSAAHRQPGAAVLLGDEGGEVSGRGERLDELGGIAAGRRSILEISPIGVGEVGAEPGHLVADLG